MADQIVQHYVHPVPADAGGDDRHPESPRSDLHQARAEDPRRRDAGDDQAPPDAQRPRGGHARQSGQVLFGAQTDQERETARLSTVRRKRKRERRLSGVGRVLFVGF